MAGGKGRPDESGRNRSFGLISTLPVSPRRAAMGAETTKKMKMEPYSMMTIPDWKRKFLTFDVDHNCNGYTSMWIEGCGIASMWIDVVEEGKNLGGLILYEDGIVCGAGEYAKHPRELYEWGDYLLSVAVLQDNTVADWVRKWLEDPEETVARWKRCRRYWAEQVDSNAVEEILRSGGTCKKQECVYEIEMESNHNLVVTDWPGSDYDSGWMQISCRPGPPTHVGPIKLTKHTRTMIHD
jgi:hypothetical protein